MKKIFCFILCVLIVILMTACNMETNEGSTTENTDKSDTTDSTNTSSSSTSSDTLRDTDDTETTDGAYNESPHVTPAFKFKSIKQLHEFCAVATSSQEKYDQYVADYGVTCVPEYILLEDAREIAIDITKALLFSEDTATAFGATYFVDANVLDIGYTINGTRYLMTYYKTLEYADIQPEGELVLSNISVDDTTVDLYWVSNGLTGFIPEGNNRLTRIRIYDPVNHDVPPSADDLALDKFIWVEPEDFDLYIDTTANVNNSQPTYQETDAETVAESTENVSTVATNESTSSCETTDNITAAETNIPLDTDISWDSEYTDEPCTEVSAFESLIITDGRTSNEVIKDYYVTQPVITDLSTAISDYAERGNASESFSDLYSRATGISTVEIYGDCFEYTSLKGLAFYNGSEMIGYRAVILENVNGQIVIKDEIECVLYKDHPLESDIVFNTLRNCLENFEDIQLIGISYVNYGYSHAYPVGILNGETDIKYYLNEEMNLFGCVDTFTTVAEAQQAYADYLAFRNNQYERLPIYGVDDPMKYTGVLRVYENRDVWERGIPKEEFQYLFDSDWDIAIPLLDENGNEDNYCLHLLYSKNKLIAELVLKITDDFKLITELEVVAEKDSETNQYVPLEESKYYTQVTELLAEVEDLDTVKGVCFDGENYTLIYKE